VEVLSVLFEGTKKAVRSLGVYLKVGEGRGPPNGYLRERAREKRPPTRGPTWREKIAKSLKEAGKDNLEPRNNWRREIGRRGLL